MNIERLNISGFGKLIAKEFQLKEGINVVYAPNETGKSTLAAFLRFMLYGFAKKERASEKNPVTSKQKYIPWEGKQAGGSISLNLGKRKYVVSRTAGKATQVFTVHDALTGEPEIFHKEPGEEFFGIGIETFESTAFFGQAAFSGLEMEELESKLRNIATGADEEVSYDKAAAKLKNLFNKISGSRASSRSKMSTLNQRKEQLLAKKARLIAETSQRDIINIEEKQKKLNELSREMEEKKAKMNRAQARQQEEHNLGTERLENRIAEEREKFIAANAGISSVTKDQVNSMTIEYYQSVAELASNYKVLPPEPKRSKTGALLVILAILFAAAAVIMYYTPYKWGMLVGEALAIPLLFGGIVASLIDSKKHTDSMLKYESDMKRYEQLNEKVAHIKAFLENFDFLNKETAVALKELDRMVEKRDTHQKRLTEMEATASLRELENEKQQNSDLMDFKLQFEQLENTYNSLRISIAEDRADMVRSTSAKEELDKVECELEEIELLLDECTKDAQAVALAMTALENAHIEMARLFAPALNKAASDYMRNFSGDTRSLIVDSKGNIKVYENGVIRPLSYYSAGTVDAVYVAVRLALIDLLYGENKPPLVFDDTFANLDEKRLCSVLQMLSKQDAQVIFLTCRDPKPFLENINYNMVEF